jgi:beta-mannanase
LFGGFIGTGTIEAAEALIGRKYAFSSQYFDWSLDYISFARNNITAGRIPYVTVEPWNVTLDAIASGSQDATIQTRAAAVKGLNGKMFLRFAHEMNGNWYPWDGYHNGASASAPPKYIAAYRHIKDVFVAAGVTNVLWVFCPNMNSVPGEAWNQWANYYPGDDYVDWMCYDGYDWGNTSFASITSGIYSQFVARNGKPIMLGETSTVAVEKATWINAILPAMKSQFPMLKAFVWFHVSGGGYDFHFNSSAGSLAAYITMANDPYFNP